MIVYPNAKINLGLHVTEKRSDGFHNIETVFYPVGWCDMLELLPDESREHGITLSVSGLPVPGETDDNLIVSAYRLIAQDYAVPAVKVHLHKIIPMGAGLGGGSSDAAFFIKALNQLFELNLAWGEMHHYARQLGSDCSFFITDRPVYAEGKGDEMETIRLDLSAFHVALVYPGIHVNTGDAYRAVHPAKKETTPEEIVLNAAPADWKNSLQNDFEKPVFEKNPGIAALKEKMYAAGAVYAAMSGSGSAVFGIFENDPGKISFENTLTWQGSLGSIS
ncbi:MAG: 4-diphosphocytidyl-2-C-methyl-D-erythritol kinase [Bacteroidetes bacterium]|nr:MAG: 4-diphosphocytidyl-2-C-methyl-D-erythritol kinase [Bacteroidota bacterium]